MATTLSVRKGVLTRHINAITELLTKHASLCDEQIEGGEEDRDKIALIQRAETEIKTRQTAFEKALYAFTETVDNLEDPMTEEEEQKVSEHIHNAEEIIGRVEDFLMKLETNKQQFTTVETTPFRGVRSTPYRGNLTSGIELPRLPLPEFSGKPWQWDGFWEIYNATVHTLPISDLQKFNYLLKSLKGEARASISRFQVTSANYNAAITHLKEKYGNVQHIVTSLHRQLEQWSAKSSQLKDQRKLFDQLSAITAQLSSKGENLESPWLLSKLLCKFTESIQRRTLREKVSQPQEEAWTLKKLMATLDRVIKEEEEIEECMPRKREIPQNTMESSKKSPAVISKKRPPFCFYCDSKEHWSTECSKISTPKARLEHLKKAGRCIGCGSKTHVFADCKSKGCMRCGKKHHTSTCFQAPQGAERAVPQQSGNIKKENKKKAPRAQQNFTVCEEETSIQDEAPSLTVMKVENALEEKSGEIFLLTGIIETVHPRTGKPIKLHVLLDTGADRSFIDANLAKELELPKHNVVTMKLHTFGAKQPREVRCIDTSLCFWDSTGTKHHLRLYTHDDLTKTYCRGRLEERDLQFVRENNINLSTPIEGQIKPPEVLIGCDQLWTFINFEEENYVLPSGLILVPTRLGYMISGKRLLDARNKLESTVSPVYAIESHPCFDQWEQHWTVQPHDVEKEYCGPEKEEKALVNAQVLDNFNKSIEKKDYGYVVRLPLKQDHEHLPDNRALALHRLKSVLRKYKDEPELLNQYNEVFQDQLNKHVLEVVDEQQKDYSKQRHYLPHQPVITPEKDTTKFRIVFDASAHYKDCPSLNDVVHQGPTMLPKLFGILLRFRTGKHVLISDVEKAFLQVHLHEDDRDLTRCIWLKDINKPVTEENLVVFRFTRVTFGINASPFLLSATILYHLNNHVEDKDLAQEIASNLYVDNLFVKSESVAEGVQKYKDLKGIFDELQMNLRAFVSNSKEIMNAIEAKDLSPNLTPKVLGLRWSSTADMFSIDVKVGSEEHISKRTVAQEIASIYDPFGWLIPLLVKAKRFQQQLWKEKYSWDEPISETLQEEWHCIVRNINGFQKQIPRRVSENAGPYSLITYCDASGIAMTACTYLATEDDSNFLMAKSKVADYKRPTTIPKMEMNAVAIGARLTINTYLSLKAAVFVNKVILLTDSEIALKWVQSSLNHHGTGPYIKNRVKEVHKIVKELEEMNIDVQFGYIDTKRNPADIGTRGISVNEFASHTWWKAYSLQCITESGTSSSLFKVSAQHGEYDDSNGAITNVVNALTTKTEVKELMNLTRYSSMKKTLRVLAYVIKFLRHVTLQLQDPLRTKLQRRLTCLQTKSSEHHLTASDIENAHEILIRNHQAVHLHHQYRKELSKNLNLKEDQNCLVRAYGRLNKSELDEQTKNPLIVLPNTDLSRLIIEEAHGEYHSNAGQTMVEVRRRYWIPRLRQQVKKYIRSCIPCQKMNNLPYKYPNMTDLPAHRVTRSRPFQHTGLDYFGPITVYGDNKQRTEVHGCIFTCSVTRLIHLEVVSDGTTENFLNAFRRFVARRGKPQLVICDNAPTFILGSQIINDSLSIDPDISTDGEIHREMSNQLIEWKHITPHSPWKGGFYERLIKSVKQSLYKAIGRRILTKEQLQTFLTEIEGCINSRPLTYQESEFSDTLNPLRPIDFIQRGMVVELPFEFAQEEHTDPTFLPPSEVLQLETRIQAQKALQSSYDLTERYWDYWETHYLTALREQHRLHMDNKRGSIKKPLIGQVVLLVDPSTKRHHWKLGRITKLTPSNDGDIREVEVITNRKTLKRSINQLVPLEIPENDNTPLSKSLASQQNKPNAQTESGNLRYNLRPRKPRSRRDEVYSNAHFITSREHNTRWPLSLYLKMALTLAALTIATAEIPTTEKIDHLITSYQLQCVSQGLYLHAPQANEVEVCIQDHCIVEETPTHKTIHLPPERLLHNYEVRFKIRHGSKYTTTETECPAQPFCSVIDCTLCVANILNPECRPLSAIAGLGFILYLVIALCYTICFVPVTIGLPLRLIIKGTIGAMWIICNSIRRIVQSFSRNRRRRPRSILQALAVVALLTTSQTCQVENVFTHHLRNCKIKQGKSTCEVEVASVVKINAFKKEACLTLKNNNTWTTNVRLRWERLSLLCRKETLWFTRNVEQRIIDSKRCPHMGSCVRNKCADVNSSSLLPELAIGNSFPGITSCMESCGGPGCDCFYLSSGCLFYRIYAVPKDPVIYEIFKCSQWKEELKLRLEVSKGKTTQTYILALSPNIPTSIGKMDITLSVISIPPLPIFDQVFITSTNHTALWNKDEHTLLTCPSKEHAASLQCDLQDNCACTSAESQVKCECLDDHVTSSFLSISNVLPISRPQVQLLEHPRHGVVARIDQDITGEIILDWRETVENITTETKDDICIIKNAELVGCYNCAKGATANVTCRSTNGNLLAEIDCGIDSLSIPCSTSGSTYQLKFMFNKARIHIQCSVKCGEESRTFELTGILKYIHSLHTGVRHYTKQEHNITSDFDWPDVAHILDIYLQWYKVLLLTIVAVAAALLLSYVYFTTLCYRITAVCLSTLTKIFKTAWTWLLYICIFVCEILRFKPNRQWSKAAEKTL